jgi:lysozyme
MAVKSRRIMTFIEQIKIDEGFRDRMYTDSVGIPTIGWGFNLETVEMPRVVADLWLAFEIDKIENSLKQFRWYNYSDPVRQEVLLNMAYNLGVRGILTFSKMIKALEERDYVEASIEMMDSKWARQVGQRAIRLSETMAGLH